VNRPAVVVAAAGAGRRAWLTVFGVMVACTWCGNQFSPLLLLYRQRQHYGAVSVDAFLGVYVLGRHPALLASGALSDRYGRRPVMTGGVVTALAASTCLAFGQTGPVAICLGRLLAGVTVGIATSVGTSWLKELSQPPYDTGADTGSGARRASLGFATGSGLGALVAGTIAQWGPAPEQLPFLVHLAITIPFLWLVRTAPETSTSGAAGGTVRSRLRVPAAGHKRFTHVVLVVAPWLFASAAIAYGYVPVLLAPRTGRFGIGYATLLTVLTLGVVALVQPWAKRIDSVEGARGLATSMVFIVAGTAMAAITVRLGSPALGMATAIVFGVGLGIGMVSGILEVQRIAGPTDLAGLTGVFYAAAYAGFVTPTALAALAPVIPTPIQFLGLTAIAIVCGLTVLRSYRRHLPATGSRDQGAADGGAISVDGSWRTGKVTEFATKQISCARPCSSVARATEAASATTTTGRSTTSVK